MGVAGGWEDWGSALDSARVHFGFVIWFWFSRGGGDADGWTDRQMPVFPALESLTHDTDVGLAGVN